MSMKIARDSKLCFGKYEDRLNWSNSCNVSWLVEARRQASLTTFYQWVQFVVDNSRQHDTTLLAMNHLSRSSGEARWETFGKVGCQSCISAVQAVVIIFWIESTAFFLKSWLKSESAEGEDELTSRPSMLLVHFQPLVEVPEVGLRSGFDGLLPMAFCRFERKVRTPS